MKGGEVEEGREEEEEKEGGEEEGEEEEGVDMRAGMEVRVWGRRRGRRGVGLR